MIVGCDDLAAKAVAFRGVFSGVSLQVDPKMVSKGVLVCGTSPSFDSSRVRGFGGFGRVRESV